MRESVGGEGGAAIAHGPAPVTEGMEQSLPYGIRPASKAHPGTRPTGTWQGCDTLMPPKVGIEVTGNDYELSGRKTAKHPHDISPHITLTLNDLAMLGWLVQVNNI